MHEKRFHGILARMKASSLMIHGGAGTGRESDRYHASLRGIVEVGARLLDEGASALDVVTRCVILLEDDPLYNAGCGSVLNVDGDVRLDASIMDGRHLEAGAIAGVRGVRNPVLLARTVMERSEHVFLIGAGAEEFARANDLIFADDTYFLSQERIGELEKAKAQQGVSDKLGTVGAVARDKFGNLAAATSTGGLTNQARGRVGDSPIIGAGTYADNLTCAVSCTGIGEHLLRTTLARAASLLVELQGLGAAAAAQAAKQILVDRVQGLGGLIIIDKHGECAHAHSTPGMRTAWAKDGQIRVDIT